MVMVCTGMLFARYLSVIVGTVASSELASNTRVITHGRYRIRVLGALT